MEVPPQGRDLCDFVCCHIERVAWRLLSVVSPLQWHLIQALTSPPFWTPGRPFCCRCFAGPGDSAHLRQSPRKPRSHGCRSPHPDRSGLLQ